MTARILVGVVLSAALATPGGEPRFDKRLSKEAEAIHALNRLAYGPRPGDIETARQMGVRKWVEQQLTPSGIRESEMLQARLKPLTTLSMSQEELANSYPPPQLIRAYADGRLPLPQDSKRRAQVEMLISRYQQRKTADPSDKDSQREAGPKGPRWMAFADAESRREALATVAPLQVLVHDLYEQKLYRGIYSNRQLEEVLTDFWFNHFNVFLDKGADRFLVTAYERDAIRPHVLGKFQDMLLAVARHPAMLFYLDNWQSVSPAATRKARRSRGLNENFGRELLELHTLGVNGGYTQKDVVEVARCFTGWTIAEPFRNARFVFNPRVHDKAEKTVLGTRIPAGGDEEDGVKVLEILSRHPSTARFISTKLAHRFVADNPPDSLVEAMAATFRRSDGDLREVMRTMLGSKEFWSEAAYRSKVKSPFEIVVSAVRAADADVSYAFALAARAGQLGQPLYRKQEPTGYSNLSAEWMNSSALLGRLNFALDLAGNKIRGVKVEASRIEGDPWEVARRLTFTDLSPQTRLAIEKGIAEKKDAAVIAGLILGSPEFQRR